jgi:outer membrane lipoprotein-sorting protein
MGRAIAAALAAVLIQGCFAARPPRADETTAELPSASSLLAALQRRRDALDGMRTLARLRYRSPDGTENARNVLAVERPDRIRFEVLSMLGSLLVLASEDGSFAAYVPRESTLYRGAASPGNLAPYLPIDVTVAQIVDLLLATPPLFDGRPSAVDREDGLVRLTQRDGDALRIACFSGGVTPVRYREIDRHGRTTIDARYEDIDASGAVPVARQLTLHFPLTGEILDISMKDPEINPDLPSGFFTVTPPTDTRQIDLDGDPL